MFSWNLRDKVLSRKREKPGFQFFMLSVCSEKFGFSNESHTDILLTEEGLSPKRL